MTIPSVYDKTLISNPDHQVCGLFIQYCPNDLPWDNPSFKADFVQKIHFHKKFVGPPRAPLPLFNCIFHRWILRSRFQRLYRRLRSTFPSGPREYLRTDGWQYFPRRPKSRLAVFQPEFLQKRNPGSLFVRKLGPSWRWGHWCPWI